MADPIPENWGLRCPKCSYSLTGLTTNRCPECGEVFDVEVLLGEKRERDALAAKWKTSGGFVLVAAGWFFIFTGIFALSMGCGVAACGIATVLFVLAFASARLSWLMRITAAFGLLLCAHAFLSCLGFDVLEWLQRSAVRTR